VKGKDAYFIYMDTKNGCKRPVVVIGYVNPCSTEGRELPPDPISTFKCEGTPFGKGHVFALSNGGPDINENIVPQYQEWQENGEWRKMERYVHDNAVRSGSKRDIFVAILEYEFNGNIYDTNVLRYDSYQIFRWDDYRIPSLFLTWLIKKAESPECWESLSRVLDGGAADFTNLRVMLNAQNTVNDLVGLNLSQKKIPRPDLIQIENRFYLKPAIKMAYDNHEARKKKLKERMEEELKSFPKVPREYTNTLASPDYQSVVEFAIHNQEAVKDMLEELGPINHEDSTLGIIGSPRLVHAMAKNHGGLDSMVIKKRIEVFQQKRKAVLEKNNTKRDRIENSYQSRLAVSKPGENIARMRDKHWQDTVKTRSEKTVKELRERKSKAIGGTESEEDRIKEEK
jgi:hypothetical protein